MFALHVCFSSGKRCGATIAGQRLYQIFKPLRLFFKKPAASQVARIDVLRLYLQRSAAPLSGLKRFSDAAQAWRAMPAIKNKKPFLSARRLGPDGQRGCKAVKASDL
ncbi:hypothetical protein RCH06_001530 [Polaromonas sp. CG_9.5]|uniref:hypothetical protein n=1 Tax=Polaromonas sp. CG_9.5 TaxID=3071705 RepID=UPI002E062BDA|nr:hypothetical protein [Polaromonas sp. CG_9.5]